MFGGVQSEQVDVASAVDEVACNDWRKVDRTLRALARQRAALDAEEARWLREAQRLQIWREIGYVSLLDYMERRLGYGPRAAQERLRVAFALEHLPALEAALESGELPFTGARELSRVMTPETEDAWLDAAQDKSVHEIEQLVAGHTKGDVPEDPPDPELVTRVLRYDVRPATAALERQARAALEQRYGQRLDDDAFIAALFGQALGTDEHTAKGSGRARCQIGITLCRQCKRGWQDGAGRPVEVAPADLERATCDAQWIGDLDTNDPARVVQDITPRVRRLVAARDGKRCTVPGCRSTQNLELHHIKPQEEGGSHEPENITTICDAHHAARHRGLLSITGTAPHALVFEQRHDPDAHVDGPTQLDRATWRAQAKDAIVQLGFRRGEASSAVEGANQHLGAEITLERLIREALRRLAPPDSRVPRPS